MMDEVIFNEFVADTFNEDCAEVPFEPLTGGKGLQDLSIAKGGPSCTLIGRAANLSPKRRRPGD